MNEYSREYNSALRALHGVGTVIRRAPGRRVSLIDRYARDILAARSVAELYRKAVAAGLIRRPRPEPGGE